MKRILVIFSLLLTISLVVSCGKKNETQFSEVALNETFIDLNGDSLSFRDVIEKYRGKKILIDVWATWCGDCIKGMPNIVELQNDFPEVVFLFLSIDDSLDDLKKGIKKYNVKGEHYLLPSQWDGHFSNFLDLSWIPRYLVVGKQGEILVFDEVKANHQNILNALNDN